MRLLKVVNSSRKVQVHCSNLCCMHFQLSLVTVNLMPNLCLKVQKFPERGLDASVVVELLIQICSLTLKFNKFFCRVHTLAAYCIELKLNLAEFISNHLSD